MAVLVGNEGWLAQLVEDYKSLPPERSSSAIYRQLRERIVLNANSTGKVYLTDIKFLKSFLEAEGSPVDEVSKKDFEETFGKFLK